MADREMRKSGAMGTKNKKSDDMNETQLPRLRLFFTVLVTLAELAILTREHFNGGVQSHHILQRGDWPAFSNWWGLVLLPVLSWFLTGRAQQRIALIASEREAAKRTKIILAGFVASLTFGILLSISFARGHQNVSLFLLLVMFVLAMLLPVYRAECVLGFILGMTFTFGAVLPAIIGSIIAAASATIHLLVYANLMRLWISVRSS